MSQPNRERGGGPALSKPEEPKIPRYRGGPLKERPIFDNQSGIMSIGAHLALLLVAIVGLPEFMQSMPPEPMVMTVEVLPITDKTNVRPSKLPLSMNDKPKPSAPVPVPVKSSTPPPKPAEKTPAPEKPEEKAEETPPPAETAENVVPEKPKKEEKKADEKKPEKAKPTPPKEEKTDKSEKESLDDILKNVQKAAQESEDKTAKKTSEPAGSKTVSDAPFDPNAQMSLSQMDAIKQQLIKCWNPPAGVKDDYTLVVVMRANYAQDGTLVGEPTQVGGVSNYSAVAAAKRALQKPQCAKLNNVPKDKYAAWKQIDVTFDPKNALY